MPPHRSSIAPSAVETFVAPPAYDMPEGETLAALADQALRTEATPAQGMRRPADVCPAPPPAARKLRAGRAAAQRLTEAALAPMADAPHPAPEAIAPRGQQAAQTAGRTALTGSAPQPAVASRQVRKPLTPKSAQIPAADAAQPSPELLNKAAPSGEAVPEAASAQAPEQRRVVTVNDFTGIFTRHQTPIINFIYHRVGNREEAYDLAQDVFLRAYRALSSGTEVQAGALSSWLYTIADHASLDALRRRRLINWLPLSLFNEDRGIGPGMSEGRFDDTEPRDAPGAGAFAGSINTYHGGQFEDLIANQDIIERVFGKLGEKYRSALWLYEHVGLSIREVADALNSTDSAIKMRLKRARELFIRTYQQEVGNDPGQVFTRRRGGRRLGQIALVTATL